MYNQYDKKAAEVLDDFLPNRLFDAHAHLSHGEVMGREEVSFADYLGDMRPLVGERFLRANGIVFPIDALKDEAERRASLAFLKRELDRHPDCVAEAMVFPGYTEEEVEGCLVHPRIRGLKCYHTYAARPKTFDCYIEEYLPEAAFAVADRKKLCITLHMVRDEALSDPENLKHIKTMAKRYPDAVLILAHAARSFASWTVFEPLCELVPFENVWYDFSAVAESPSMTWILKKIGVSRCLWGSDYPISTKLGKCVSIGEGFYWIDETDIARMGERVHPRHVATENLLAVRQACMLADLTKRDVEDLFYNNAAALFVR